jgi:hypothetical protein
MNISLIPAIALAALLPLVSACGDDDGNGNPTGAATSFSATLSGDEEVPAVSTSATGTATFSITGSQITYTVTVTGVENPVVSHIHVAAAGANGPVRLNLCGTGAPVPECATGDGVLATGTNGTTLDITFDELVAAMRAGNTYVNVHTDDGSPPPNTGAGDMASGEIRGQITAD